MIKNILFDMGNVLIRFAPETYVRNAGLSEPDQKLLLRELRRTNPGVEKSIFHSIHSVCLDTMVGYKTGGVEHTFADCYRERGEMTQEDET